MKIQMEEYLDRGGFADVWRGTDELGRKVAIKIVRPSAANTADALAHAKALARTNHPNVVRVYSIEKVEGLGDGEVLDAVVMELLEGGDLATRLRGPRFDRDELVRVGMGVIAGIEHIHSQGLAHGDLHERNVMLCADGPRIIDILYLDTLAGLSTATRDVRMRRDLVSLRLLLRQLLAHSEMDPGEATEFNDLLGSSATLQEVRSAFRKVTDPMVTDNIERVVDHAYRRIVDDGFVSGPSYAAALVEDTPRIASAGVLSRIVETGVFRDEHSDYVRALWGRCAEEEKDQIAQHLSARLDKEVPGGTWWPHLKMLQHIGDDLWARVSKVTALRLENAITNDVLGGYEDIWKVTLKKGGYLGAYASVLYPMFTEIGKLAQNIVSMLSQSWYTQNYIGKRFMPVLPTIARAANLENEMIQAIRRAVTNDAKLVVSNLQQLPAEWIAKITEPTESAEE